VLCCVLGRIIIRFWKWIMMLRMMIFAPITFVLLWCVVLCWVISVLLLVGFPIGANGGVVVCAEVAPGQAERPGFYYLAISRHKWGLPGYVSIYVSMYLFLGLGIRMPSLFLVLNCYLLYDMILCMLGRTFLSNFCINTLKR